MLKNLVTYSFACFVFLLSNTTNAAPMITGEPVIVQHLGKIDWPQDTATTQPFLTQLMANDINDLHGDIACDLIISTPGNYHMALKDAMYGRADLGHIGLIEQQDAPDDYKVSICWSTSPPISVEQSTSESLQFKNITLNGRPSLVMAPGTVMDTLVQNNHVHAETRQALLTNQGNVLLIRSDKAAHINNICDLAGSTRVITPHPQLEPGSFGNFSDTIFNIADQNYFGCNATDLFNSIFSQDISLFDLSVFNYPYNINGVLSVFGRGSRPQGTGAKWVASSRIMHRDLAYGLCNDEADAAVVFYHLALYLRNTLATSGCRLKIVPLGGTVSNPVPLPGNKVASLHIAKSTGIFSRRVSYARHVIYNFLTSSPVWHRILHSHGIMR